MRFRTGVFSPMRPTPVVVVVALLTLIFSGSVSLAQTPTPPKRIPPPGLTLTDAEHRELAAGAAALRRDIDALTSELAAEPKLIALLPDVEIFHKAVDWALHYD